MWLSGHETFCSGGAPRVIKGHFCKRGEMRFDHCLTFCWLIRDPSGSHLDHLLILMDISESPRDATVGEGGEEVVTDVTSNPF